MILSSGHSNFQVQPSGWPHGGPGNSFPLQQGRWARLWPRAPWPDDPRPLPRCDHEGHSCREREVEADQPLQSSNRLSDLSVLLSIFPRGPTATNLESSTQISTRQMRRRTTRVYAMSQERTGLRLSSNPRQTDPSLSCWQDLRP